MFPDVTSINAVLFLASEMDGDLISLLVKHNDIGGRRASDVNIAYILPPPWTVKEFYVGNVDGSLMVRYSAITSQSINPPISRAFQSRNPNSKWKGDMIVMRHHDKIAEELISMAASEIDLLASAIAFMEPTSL